MDPQGWIEIRRSSTTSCRRSSPSRGRSDWQAIAAVHPEVCRSVEALLDADATAAGSARPPRLLFGVSARSDQRILGLADEAATGDPLGLSGRRVSHFQVQEAVGAGGMGVVPGGGYSTQPSGRPEVPVAPTQSGPHRRKRGSCCGPRRGSPGSREPLHDS